MHKTFFRALAILVVALHAPDAIAACLPDPPADGDAVVCDGIDSTGYDASGATGLTITTSGVTTLTDGDAGLRRRVAGVARTEMRRGLMAHLATRSPASSEYDHADVVEAAVVRLRLDAAKVSRPLAISITACATIGAQREPVNP